jgi:hypothetical protein
LRDDKTGIARPATTLPSKLAGEMTTSKALKAATDAQEKLKALYLECKQLTEANNTRPVRGAVELVYAAYSAFDEAVKVFNKQLMQEEQEAEAAEIVEKKKKSSWGGLSLVASADDHRPDAGKTPCEYCGQVGCDYDCDESQAGGFNN